MSLKVNYSYLMYQIGINQGPELVQTEDRFTEIKDALKTLNKMDFDKLVASVSPAHRLFSTHFIHIC